MKKTLKNALNVFKHLGITTLVVGTILHSAYMVEKQTSDEYDSFLSWLKREKTTIKDTSPTTAVKLSNNDTIEALATFGKIKDMLLKNNGQYVRFEAMENTPIYIVVNDNSISQDDKNIIAIKNSINNYNEIFKVINTNYKFEYISKYEFEKNAKNEALPHIDVGFSNSIHTKDGIELNAIAYGLDAFTSQYGNGQVDMNSIINLSKSQLYNLNETQTTTVVMHAMAHALGVSGHNNNENSILYTNNYGNSILSATPSADLLHSLTALYYNQETSDTPYIEILSYINSVANKRQAEIADNFTTEM